jgi:hypothetical protein
MKAKIKVGSYAGGIIDVQPSPHTDGIYVDKRGCTWSKESLEFLPLLPGMEEAFDKRKSAERKDP